MVADLRAAMTLTMTLTLPQHAQRVHNSITVVFEAPVITQCDTGHWSLLACSQHGMAWAWDSYDSAGCGPACQWITAMRYHII